MTYKKMELKAAQKPLPVHAYCVSESLMFLTDFNPSRQYSLFVSAICWIDSMFTIANVFARLVAATVLSTKLSTLFV
jgi:hypothetical protein